MARLVRECVARLLRECVARLVRVGLAANKQHLKWHSKPPLFM